MDREQIARSATDPAQIALRMDLARFTAITFREAGLQLHAAGHIIGDDRLAGRSPFGHGNDGTVAVAMLLRIGNQLVSASADLISDGRHYAGSALIRQLVEIEYLAWAFETKHEDAARWLRSDREERRNFFTPAKLRSASEGRFRSVDYGFHCELGGHPVPGSWLLLNDDQVTAQLMLSDCLGHAGRVWDHVVQWAHSNPHGFPILSRAEAMLGKYVAWKQADILTQLPPAPEFPQGW